MVKIASKSVKTRRKPLVCNDVFLQMAGSTRWRNGFGLTAINLSPVAWREEERVSRKNRPNIACLCDRLFLQMAGSTRLRDGLTIQGSETCTCCITEIRGGERQKQRFFEA